MINRLLFRNAVLLIVINVLIKPLYTLVIEPAVQHRIGMSEYGRYAALLNITLIASVLLDLGITGWNTIQTSKARGISSVLYYKVIRIRLLLALLYISFVMILVYVLGYNSQDIMMALVIGITQICSSFILFLRSYTSGTLSFADDRLLSVLDKVLLFITMATIMWLPNHAFHPLTVNTFIWVQLAVSLSVLLIGLLLIRKYKYHKDGELSNHTLLKSAVPYGMLFLFNIMMLRCDTIMLDFIKGPEEAGRYMMSYRFFEAIIMIAYLMSNILLPSFARYHKDSLVLNRIFNSGFRTALSVFLIGVCTVLLVRREILEEVYGFMGNEEIGVFTVMIVSSFFFALQYVTGSFLTSMERMKSLLSISIIGLVLNVSLNLYLIPIYGSLGAAYSSVCTHILILCFQFFFVASYFKDDYTLQTGIRSLLLTLAFSVATFCMISIGMAGIEKAVFTFAFVLSMIVVLFKTRMLDLFFIRESVNNKI